MKKYLIFLLSVVSGIANIWGAPSQPLEIVQAYADNLSAWSETKDLGFYSGAIENLCDDVFRANDALISDYINRPDIDIRPSAYYTYNIYEMCLGDIISRGGHIKIKDIAIDNSTEFSTISYDLSDPVTIVSGELLIEGGVNYKAKEVFRIKNGKITHILNYAVAKSMGRAFSLCKEGKFKDAYDIFENIMYTSQSFGEKYVATKFAISILLKKGGQLKMDEYVKKYKLARNILFDKEGTVRAADYPMLDDKTFTYYALNYENHPDYRNRVAVLPTNWAKAIPYTSKSKDLGPGDGWYAQNYYRKIMVPYRHMEMTRFPKFSKKLFGYVDENGKDVILAQYKFAYPFDEVTGLALVQHTTGKWGYIDMQGKPRTPQNYDVASDVFVNGKTNVIRDGYLILIDTEGNELKSVYGYTDLSHKKKENEMLAVYSVDSMRCDLIDFDGNIIESPYTGRRLDYYEDTGGCSLSNSSYRIIGQRLSESDKISQQKIVDLGLSVKWAGWNLGATVPEEDGIHCGWADPTGKDETGKDKKHPVRDPKTNQWVTSSYGGVNPPERISGTPLDVATAQWGTGWRLPTKEEFQELIDKCQWKKVTYNGVLGYIVIGPNKNSIFLGIGNLDNSRRLDVNEYWSGDLDTSNTRKHAYVLKIESRKAPTVYWEWRDRRPCVRPVYER